MYEKFTDRARKVMALANQEAGRFNHEYVGTEHILLGLIDESGGVAVAAVRALGVDPQKLRSAIEGMIKSGPDVVAPGKLPQTPRAKKVIELAVVEARNLGHSYVGSEHLLLALMGVKEGPAAEVLRDAGLTIEPVREELLNLLHASANEGDAGLEEVTRAWRALPAAVKKAILAIVRDAHD